MSQPRQRNPLCVHGYAVCSKCSVITDAAKRMSEGLGLLVISHPWDTICNTWVAIRLLDGSVITTMYETWEDAAARYDSRYYAIFFMRNALGGCPARDCQIYLDMRRHVSEKGGKWVVPAQSHIVSTRSHDIITGRVNPRAN
jgi:hypothetical protein